MSTEALCSYLPASIFSFLLDNQDQTVKIPCFQPYDTCVLFADVSGYTALCEAMAAKGPEGDELLAKHLNSYFELLVRTMSSQGGDVFKFAGDAILVVWPPSDEDLNVLTRRAGQCALEIKRNLQDVELAKGVKLSVKVGVGVGKISILHIGGVFGRMEYCATGTPLVQAFQAEHHAKPRDVIMSPEAWELVKNYFTAELEDGFASLKECINPVRKVSVFKYQQQMRNMKQDVLKNVGKYVPSAVLPFINHSEEKWASELRRITVLFVNLGFKEADLAQISTDEDLKTVHTVLEAVQHAVYRYEGSLNKFLMDDKGSTLIAVFGLPPLAHEDDAVRGVLSALAVCSRLHELGLKPAVGITTGMAFCGVVGSRGKGRREYSVLGDTVNLAARLMQYATKHGGGVVCDTATQYAARHRLHFEDLPRINVKGKAKPVSVYQPYPKSLSSMVKKLMPTEIPIQTDDLFSPSSGGPSTPGPRRNSLVGGSLTSLLDPAQAAAMSMTPSHSGSIAGGKGGAPGFAGQKQRLNFAGIRKIIETYAFPRPSKSTREPSVISRPNRRGSSPDVESLTANLSAAGSSPAAAAPPDSPSAAATVAASVEVKSRAPEPLDVEAPSDPRSLLRMITPQAITRRATESMPPASPTPASPTSTPTPLVVITEPTTTTSGAAAAGGSGVPPAVPEVPTEQPKRLLAARVILPEDKGQVTIPCAALETVQQLNNQVWTFFTKTIQADDEKQEHFHLVLQGSDRPLADDFKLAELAQTAPIVTLKYAKGPDFHPLDTKMRAHRELLLHKVHTLIKESKGGTIVIEGDIGFGKSRLLSSTICEVPSPATVAFGAGNPFEMNRPLSVWRDILLQYIDSEINNKPLEFTGDFNQNRKQYLLSKLSNCLGHNNEGLDTYAACLNDIIGTDFEESTSILALKDSDMKVAYAQTLVLHLIQIFAQQSPLICVIDDALFMDEKSWTLTQTISREVENMLLVLATRPINKSYMAAFAEKIPREYRAILEDADHTTPIRLEPREPEVMKAITCEYLGPNVTEVPELLWDLIHRKAFGNPLVVKELVYALKKQETVIVKDEVVTLRDDLAASIRKESSADIPVPITLQGILGTRIDRLTHIQRMILKSAAIVGEEFSFDLMQATYPLTLDSQDQLGKELQGLVELKIIAQLGPREEHRSKLASEGLGPRRAQQPDGSDEPDETLFAFTNGFMREMLLSRMLNYQKKRLKAKAAESRLEKLGKKAARIGSTPPSIHGYLSLVKSTGAKSKYMAVVSDMLAFWDSEAEFQNEETIGQPETVIFLRDLTVQEEGDCGLVFSSLSWMETGEYAQKLRTYHIVTPSPEERDMWIAKVKPFIFHLKAPSDSGAQMDEDERAAAGSAGGKGDGDKAESQQPHVRFYGVDVDTLSPEQKKEAETEFMSSISRLNTAIVDGNVWVKKQQSSFFGNWKSRWMAVGEESIVFRRSKKDDIISQAISLAVGSPAIFSEGYDEKLKLHLARFDVSLSSKRQQAVWGRRTVTIGLKDKAATEALAKAVNASLEKLRPKHATAGKRTKSQSFLVMRAKSTMLTPSRPASATISASSPTPSVSSSGTGISDLLPGSPTPSSLASPVPRKSSAVRPLAIAGSPLGLSLGTALDQVDEEPSNPNEAAEEAMVVAEHKKLSVIGAGLSPVAARSSTIAAMQKQAGAAVAMASAGAGDEDLVGVASEQGGLLRPAHRDEKSGGVSPGPTATTPNLASRTPSMVSRRSSHSHSGLDSDSDDPDRRSRRRHHRRRRDDHDEDEESDRDMSDEESRDRSGGRLRLRKGSLARSSGEGLTGLFDASELQPVARPPPLVTSGTDIATTQRELLQTIEHALGILDRTKHLRPEVMRDILLSVRQSVHSLRVAPSFVQMVDSCDIDTTTKTWLAQNYSKENVPVRARAPTMTQIPAGVVTVVQDQKASSDELLSVPLPLADVAASIDLGDLLSWDWDIFAYTEQQLTVAVAKVFQHFNFFETYHIPMDKFQRWVLAVRNGYPDNAFHNFYHAVDICQTVFSLLTTMEGGKLLTSLERLSILMAALVHDIQHPGLNNTYQVNAGTELALLYNDQSVLEHHHCACAFRILQEPDCNVLSGLSPADYRVVRGLLTTSILATDMTCHFVLLEKFNAVLEARSKRAKAPGRGVPGLGLPETDSKPLDTDAERAVILNIMLHSADISNPCKQWRVARRWSDCILEEFFNQGDVEKADKLPISPNCDRETTDRTQIPLNFIDFIVAPIFVSLRQLLPGVQRCCNHLRDNRHDWAKILYKNLESSDRTVAEKEQDKQRWQRRTESFQQILLPPAELLEAAARPESAVRRSAPRRNSILVLEQFVKANSAQKKLRKRSSSGPTHSRESGLPFLPQVSPMGGKPVSPKSVAASPRQQPEPVELEDAVPAAAVEQPSTPVAAASPSEGDASVVSPTSAAAAAAAEVVAAEADDEAPAASTTEA